MTPKLVGWWDAAARDAAVVCEGSCETKRRISVAAVSLRERELLLNYCTKVRNSCIRCCVVGVVCRCYYYCYCRCCVDPGGATDLVGYARRLGGDRGQDNCDSPYCTAVGTVCADRNKEESKPRKGVRPRRASS